MKDRLAISIAHQHDRELYVFALKGKVDMVGARGLEGLADACELQGIKNVILEVSGIKDINAPGLGALLEFARKVEGNGGRLILVSVPPKVKKAFQVHEVLDHFFIKEDVSAAIEELCLSD